LERIRQYAGFTQFNVGSKTSHKYENFLGPKILSWLGKQIKDFAVESGIVGDDGKAMGNITLDLMQDHPEKVGDIVISAILDKKSARDVYSQTAMMTRLRSILLRNSEADLRSKLIRAIRSSKKLEDPWEKRPEWWDDSTDRHSYVLLKQLNEYGFLWIMDVENARDGFGAPDVDYNDMKELQLTKPSIQIKANQIVRELSQIEEHEDTMQMLQRRRSRGSMDSLADCQGNSEVTSTEKKKGHVQTGLMAFFPPDSTKRSLQAKNKTSASNPANENARNGDGGSPHSFASVGKRKESPVQANDSKLSSGVPKKAKNAEAEAKEIVDLSKED
jgi:hypothetical protein